MKQVSRGDPSFPVKLGVALSLFNAFVLFEETVVDRLGWWRYMPCYRVGRFCEWDVSAILIILAVSTVAYPESRARVSSFLRRTCRGFGCPICRAA